MKTKGQKKAKKLEEAQERGNLVALVEAAKDIQSKLDLDKAPPLDGTERDLTAWIKAASELISKDDKLAPATEKVIKGIVKSAPAKKAAKAKGGGKREGGTIAAVIIEGINKGKDTEDILKAVKAKFPKAKTTPACVAYYRCKVKKG